MPLAATGRRAAGSRPTMRTEALLCEVAWEVCQQVGGIYTVLRSKAPEVRKHFADRYCLIGPYNPEVTPAEFEETPPEEPFVSTIQALRDLHIEVHYGRWLITGRPRVILFNGAAVRHRLGEIKYLYWRDHGIAMPDGDGLVDDVLCFGHQVEQFFRLLTQETAGRRPVIAHFHEWMGGAAIPRLCRAQLPIRIIFTTHATLLGRYLASQDPWFYDHAPFVDWEADARRFNIEPQVRIERAATHGAQVFTTVSEITGYECEHLLGRKPDLCTPNGLNIERFAALHEFQNLHRLYKERIHQFVRGHFFPSYSFDLDRTLYFFSSGRFEYRNKGFDMTIEALARLNARMKTMGTDRTVVFFLITKRPFRSINPETLRHRAVMEEMRNTCQEIKDQFGDLLFDSVAMGHFPDFNELIDEHWRLRLRRMMHFWQSPNLPPIITHDLWDDQQDEVLNGLRDCRLLNQPDDPVKVIYHPDFVASTSPLFALEYDQFVRGCHLGIFPSSYEPWGYTPLECVARGIPAVTSDLAGFGTYVAKHIPGSRDRGILVVGRRHQAYDQGAEELTRWLLEFVQFERRGRISLRNRVESTASHFDWNNMFKHYVAAYQQALS